MDERKKRILQAVVDDYIETAEPVGSRVLSKKDGIGFSAATIRNEMADLEEMGYLDKPHTSSGRVPSNRGYRFYVNSLMQDYKLSINEIAKMREAMELRVRELDELVSEASKIISQLTNYTVIASTPRPLKNYMKSIKIVPVATGRVVLIAVSGVGVIKNQELLVSSQIPYEKIVAFSALLEEKMTGFAYNDFDSVRTEIEKSDVFCEEIWDKVSQCLSDWFGESAKSHVHAGGVVNIFNHPEYKDISKAKDFIGFLDSKDNLNRIIENIDDDSKIKIIIGEENGDGALRDCSIVISNYDIGNKARGSIGIIGPTRMDYAKIISTLEVITDRLNNIIYNLFF